MRTHPFFLIVAFLSGWIPTFAWAVAVVEEVRVTIQGDDALLVATIREVHAQVVKGRARLRHDR